MAAAVAQQMGLTTHRSPTLAAVIEMGVPYGDLQPENKVMIFDTRGLLAGFLLYGRGRSDSINYENSASWFLGWLEQRFGAKKIDYRIQMPNPAELGDLSGVDILISRSIVTLVATAQRLAQVTIGSGNYEARHLMAAMIEEGAITKQVGLIFDIELSETDLTDLKTYLIDNLMKTAGPDEKRQAWMSALGLSVDGTGDVPGPSRAGNRVPGFIGDRPQKAGPGADGLGMAGDAQALARLMCLSDAAPLAIAVFGKWGSGKSTFMERLDAEVRAIAPGPEPEAKTTSDARDGPRFVRRVVQMRFNAWQFIDANLWTSLTAEFFDQLRAGGWDRAGAVRHAGLVERVNRHVHSLSAEVATTRAAVNSVNRTVVRAQKARDEAAERARRAPGQALGQATVDMLGETYSEQKGNLGRLGLDAGETDKAVIVILDAVRNSRSIWSQFGVVSRVVSASPTRLKAVRLAIFILVVTVGATVAWAAQLGDLAKIGMAAWTGAATAALGALGALATAVAPAVSLVRAVAERSAAIAGAVEAADRRAAETVLKAEIHLRDISAEAAALQAAADRAAGRLARYIDPAGVANPPRLLRYVLEDDPNTQTLVNELGLIGRTRRLFQAVDDIVREERNKPPEQRTDGDVPDRIVLYIDDLDRCTEEQVYAVLQAVHLLLAFDLFVVVVGVDIKWVQNALGKVLGYRLETTQDVDKQSEYEKACKQRAAQYLEKIFQIAIWLNPLSSGGPGGGTYGAYVRELLQSSSPSGGTALAGSDGQSSKGDETIMPGGSGQRDRDTQDTTGKAGEDVVREGVRAASMTRALESLILLQQEIDFLASPAIAGIAATTPRAIKRLINVYRLVRSRMEEVSASSSSPPPAYPLIALMVAIETGQPVEIADELINALRELPPHSQWYPPGKYAAKTETMKNLFNSCEGLGAAVEAARTAQNNSLTVAQALEVSRLVRRYSFNQPEVTSP